MNKQQILNALDPSWWTLSQPNNWQTSFVSANINFQNSSGTTMTYTSSAPYVTYGLNQSGVYSTYDPDTGTTTQTIAPNQSRTTDGVNTLSTLISELMTQTAQRLYDMHCTNVVGYSELSSVYGAQS